jgi:hypothetical protein
MDKKNRASFYAYRIANNLSTDQNILTVHQKWFY